jgi:hypothetical protein
MVSAYRHQCKLLKDIGEFALEQIKAMYGIKQFRRRNLRY